MIVCHCRRVCDRVIRAAIRAGASSEEAVSDACGAGSRCGGCIPALTELLEEERAAEHVHLKLITSAA
jgi:bacterioferritin-associated ferredoxin